MRLLIATGIYPPDSGGPATYSKLLHDELPAASALFAGTATEGITVDVFSFGQVRHLPKGVSHLAYFFGLLKRGRHADIIFAQDPVSVGLPSWLASRLLGKKFLLKIVGDYAWEQGVQRGGIKENLDEFVGLSGAAKNIGDSQRHYPFFVSLLKKIQARVAHGATRIIVPSNYMRAVVGAWGISAERITVIYNSFDAPAVKHSKKEIRQRIHITPDQKLIISAGRFVPWKGMSLLISLMPVLRRRFTDLQLIIVGSGPQQSLLQRLVSDLDLVDAVTFAGQVSHESVLDYISAGDIFVLNTAYEGFSHLLLEVMALGTPLITTSVGGNTELVKNGKEAILVEYNDRIELEKAIVKLFSDPLCAQEHVVNAKKKVALFSKKRMFGELIAVLNNLAGPSKKTAKSPQTIK